MDRKTKLALTALAGAYFTLGVSTLSVVGLALPMAQDMKVDVGAIAQLVTVFALTYAMAAPLLQMIVGGWDRRRLLVIGLLAIAAGSFLGAATQSFAVLTGSRVLMALGGALVGPMTSATAAALVAPAERGAALGVVFTGMTIATVLGVPLASWLGAALNWQSVLALIGGLALLAALICVRTLPAGSRGARTTPRDLIRVASNPILASAISVTFFQMAAQFITYAVIGAYLVTAQGVGAEFIPIGLMLFGLGGIAGNAAATRLTGRLGQDRLISIGLIGISAIFAVLIPASETGLWAFVPLVAWAALGTMMMAPQQTRLVGLAPETANLVLALNASALYLGMAAGAAAGGAILSGFGAGALPAFSLFVALVALTAFTVSRRSVARVRGQTFPEGANL